MVVFGFGTGARLVKYKYTWSSVPVQYLISVSYLDGIFFRTFLRIFGGSDPKSSSVELPVLEVLDQVLLGQTVVRVRCWCCRVRRRALTCSERRNRY